MTLASPRTAAVAVAAFRVGYGALLTARPERLALRWLGPSSATDPTKVALRGLGARDAVINGGALVAAVTGSPVRPWLGAAIAGDLADLGATLAGRAGLPDGSAKAAALVIGASVALTGAALAIQER
ncbi:hypothetical protein [Baekduia soli]|uniref:hypothetical protein n=1 Tax=Baekduia soli TaxID=496014 RepID=UPI0016525038|nr:hypothetical protein [Baekduia soli]